jgi:hypothetical protein
MDGQSQTAANNKKLTQLIFSQGMYFVVKLVKICAVVEVPHAALAAGCAAGSPPWRDTLP